MGIPDLADQTMEYAVLGVVAVLILLLFVITFWRLLREERSRWRSAEPFVGSPCQACRQGESQFYVFRTCRCFGVAPIAAVWDVSMHEAYLCGRCARSAAIAACRETGLYGGWGYPGVLAVVLYTCANINALVRTRSAGAGVILLCILRGIVVAWLLLALGCGLLILLTFLVRWGIGE